MNFSGIRAIYIYEMTRFFRTFFQSFISPIVSTSLYFVVFGTAIGSKIGTIDDVSYGAFSVAGLIILYIMKIPLDRHHYVGHELLIDWATTLPLLMLYLCLVVY